MIRITIEADPAKLDIMSANFRAKVGLALLEALMRKPDLWGEAGLEALGISVVSRSEFSEAPEARRSQT